MEDGELATIVITEANTRSVGDIVKMLERGYGFLRDSRRTLRAGVEESEPSRQYFDELSLLSQIPSKYSVALSNVGKFGLTSGSGALSACSASTEVTVGERRRLPKWYGVSYFPAWHVTLGCLQDHRAMDGQEAGVAMRLMRRELSRSAIRKLRRASDTIPGEIKAKDPRGGTLGNVFVSHSAATFSRGIKRCCRQRDDVAGGRAKQGGQLERTPTLDGISPPVW